MLNKPLSPFLNVGDEISLKIEKLTLGGKGLGRHQGLVVFVPFAATGDELLVKIKVVKKSFVEGEIIKILKSGSGRIEAPCPYYHDCGGCNFQHLSYESQLLEKQKILEDQLKTLINENTLLKDPLASPQLFNYRNRVQLKISQDKENKTQIGFFARKSHALINIDNCLLCEEPLNKRLASLLDASAIKKLDGFNRIQLFLDQDGKAQALPFNLKNSNKPFDVKEGKGDDKAKDRDENSYKDPSENERYHREKIASQEENEETFYTHEEEGFSQVNRFQNEKLIEAILQLCSINKEDPSFIYDLYAGSGNFSFSLLNYFSKTKIIAVEKNNRSVENAHKKIKNLNLSPKQILFFCSDVDLFLKRSFLETNSVVILDPPRIGASKKVIKYLAKQNFKKLLYLSCNPSTLNRDLNDFIKESNQAWSLKSLQLFDMFPQTDHIEALAELIPSTT